MKRVSLLLALCIAPAALAQESWLAPEKFTGVCGGVSLRMATMSSVAPDGVARAVEMVPGRRLNLTPQPYGQTVEFYLNVPGDGLTTVAVDLAAKAVNLTPTDLTKFLDRANAAEAVRADWSAHPAALRVRSTAHAKTFLRCGQSDNRYQLSSDSGLEFVPQGVDPTLLSPGQKFPVILVGKGKNLYRDVPIALLREDGSRVAVVTPDKTGIATFEVPAPGRYLLTATALTRSDSSDFDWLSDSATLSFEVTQSKASSAAPTSSIEGRSR